MSPALGFNLPVYLENSQKLDVNGLAWDEVPNFPLSRAEIRILTYTMDIESNTIVYLKELLSSGAAEDPDVTAFLSCWAYEEYFHGHYLRRFLDAAGVNISPERFAEVSTQRSLAYRARQLGQHFLASVFRKGFLALYLTWGAINELATLQAYTVVAARTQHPILADLLRRIVRDERRHFAFYFHQARRRLGDRFVRYLTATVVTRFWSLVGTGERPQADVDFVLTHLVADERGQRAAHEVTRQIRELPGLELWDGLWRSIDTAQSRHAF